MSAPKIPVGSRVELSPGMDAWMRGDRFGDVVGYGRKPYPDGSFAHCVKLDKSGRIVRLPADRFSVIESPIGGAS